MSLHVWSLGWELVVGNKSLWDRIKAITALMTCCVVLVLYGALHIWSICAIVTDGWKNRTCVLHANTKIELLLHFVLEESKPACFGRGGFVFFEAAVDMLILDSSSCLFFIGTCLSSLVRRKHRLRQLMLSNSRKPPWSVGFSAKQIRPDNERIRGHVDTFTSRQQQCAAGRQ